MLRFGAADRPLLVPRQLASASDASGAEPSVARLQLRLWPPATVRLACWVCARVHASTAGGMAPLAVLDSGLPRRALFGSATTLR